MERDNLIKQLKTIGETKAGGRASEAWVRNTRDRLMAKAKSDLEAMPRVEAGDVKQLALALDMGMGWQKSLRPVVAAVVAVILVFGGWTATVSASYNSLPGEKLYSVKIFTEGTQLSFNPSKENKTKMRMDFAGRRLDEVAKLVESPVSQKEKRIEDAMSLFKKNMEDVEKDLEEIKSGKDSKKVVDVAKDVDRKAEAYEKTIKETMNKIPDEAKGKAKEAKAVVGGVGVKAIEVLLEKHLQGQTEDVSEEEVVEKLTKKLQAAEESIQELELADEEAAETADEEGEAADEEAVETADEEGEAADEEAAETADEEGEATDEEAAETADEEGEAADEEAAGTSNSTGAAQEAKNKVAEGKERLVNKDLAGALDTVREVNTIVQAMETEAEAAAVGEEAAAEEGDAVAEEDSPESTSSTNEAIIEEEIDMSSVTTTDEIID